MVALTFTDTENTVGALNLNLDSVHRLQAVFSRLDRQSQLLLRFLCSFDVNRPLLQINRDLLDEHKPLHLQLHQFQIRVYRVDPLGETRVMQLKSFGAVFLPHVDWDHAVLFFHGREGCSAALRDAFDCGQRPRLDLRHEEILHLGFRSLLAEQRMTE